MLRLQSKILRKLEFLLEHPNKHTRLQKIPRGTHIQHATLQDGRISLYIQKVLHLSSLILVASFPAETFSLVPSQTLDLGGHLLVTC